MDIVLTIVFLIIIIFATSGMVAREQSLRIFKGQTVADVCDFERPETATILDRKANEIISIDSIGDDDDILAPFDWSVDDDLWRGYNAAKPFDQPNDARVRYFVRFYNGDTVRWIMILSSKTTPDTYYVYAFDNTTPFADSNDNHFGHHPCKVFRMSATEVDDWVGGIRDDI